MGKNKIKLKVLHVDSIKTPTYGWVLSLIEVNGKQKNKRIIPIVIGGYEAQAIAIASEKIPTSRPLTHELFFNFARAIGVNVTEVIINRFTEGVFYAVIIFSDGTKSYEIDSRTSDAVALALRFNCPIYTYEEILDSVGVIDNIGLGESQDTTEEDRTEASEEKDLSSFSLAELQEMLNDAIENEDYEKASKIRDEINKKK